MHLLYPSDPFDLKLPDDAFREEFDAARTAGLHASVFSLEDFESGRFRARPIIQEGEVVLYRGWMLTPERYADLVAELVAGRVLACTNAQQYRLCHYLPEWYPSISHLTSDTVFLAEDANFVLELGHLKWPGYFVKDFVKSLNTAGGSLVDTPDQIANVVRLMRQFRGRIEGGICVRRREDYIPDSERRYFIVRGRAFSADGEVPDIVAECARSIHSPFFSVDVVRQSDGALRVVELGDGQVSDRKEWNPTAFSEVLLAVGKQAN